ncbi:HEAT repeat domain-containing protein [Streptomyces sp. NPDC002812]|uniref:HEAT repeat domain-containing protein n=1 Tax=Streptomyces sp. NPDC002812 TaxID=3154434 RepID=UPI003327E8E0
MTPEDRQLIMGLVHVPGGGRRLSPEEVLQHFRTEDGQALGCRLLQDALDRRDALDVEMALILCTSFGFTADHVSPLVQLCWAEWHQKHEDVVAALSTLRSPRAVDALHHAAQWVPDYLDYDENRSLAAKAIRGLGALPGPEAEQALMQLLESDEAVVRERAAQQLERRKS